MRLRKSDRVLPQMRHFENDTWRSLNCNTAASGYPMVISAAYGRGTFQVLVIPPTTSPTSIACPQAS